MARVLLIEDDFFLRTMLKHALGELGHSVVEAANAMPAETLHLEHDFEVILTDLIMPDRDGFELLSEFGRNYPEVRIIAMSAGGQISAPDYLAIAQKLGAAAVLKKPVTDEQLERVLNSALQQ